MRNLINNYIYLISIILILIVCVSCKKDDENEIVTNDDIIKLILDKTEVVSDGKAKIKLTAKIPKESASDKRNITFKSSIGKFDTNTDDKTTVTKPVDQDGYTSVDLTIGTKPGLYTISASVGANPSFSDEETIIVKPISIEERIDLSFENINNLKADGVSTIKVISKITNSPVDKVTIESSAGNLLGTTDTKNVTLNLNQEGVAEIYLKVDNTVQDYYVSAKIADPEVSLTKQINTNRALAEKMNINPSSLKIDSINGEVSINVYLLRNVGKVSTNTQVEFEAYQNISNQAISVGRFSPAKIVASNSEGIATVAFKTEEPGISKSSPIIIKVNTIKDDGSPLVKEVQLYLKE